MKLRWSTLVVLVGAGCSAHGPNRPTSDLPLSLCPQTFSPCGGDVVATWNLVAQCPMSSGDNCQTNVQDSSLFRGTVVFGADLSFTETTTLKGTQTATIPNLNGCIPARVKTCSDLAPPPTPKVMVSCTGDPMTSCTCTYTYNDYSTTLSGTYQLAGTDLTLNYNNRASTVGYCVQSASLLLPGNASGFLYRGTLVYSR